jgi:hypothetical protein
MANHSPGWYPDALGRYAQRYYDGNAWTEHVADAAGNRGIDPVQGAAAPASSGGFAPPASSAVGGPGAPGSTSAPSAATGGTWSATGPSPAPHGGPGTAATPAPAGSGGVAVTVGLLVAGVGALLTLLGQFALDYWSADGVGVTLGDIADAPSGADINGLASAYADVGRFLGLLVIALAIVAVLRLPALKQYDQQLPMIAAVVAGVWGLWHLIGLFLAPDPGGPAVAGFLGVIGYAALAAGQFLRQPLGTTAR